MIDKQRVFNRNNRTSNGGSVVYWMSRDQRINNNWALLYAIELANQNSAPVHVAFCLAPTFPNASIRHYQFMLNGLMEVEQSLLKKGIAFHLLKGNPAKELTTFIRVNQIAMLVSDSDPLRIKQNWKEELDKQISIPHLEVDAHNIVPCRLASQKAEFGAYTLRPKIKKLLPQFLVDFPSLPKVIKASKADKTNWDEVLNWLNPDISVAPISWLPPGERAAQLTLNMFITERLNGYAQQRNNPNLDAQSNLSAYLHFGQLSAQKVAIDVIKANAPETDKAAFLEELIVRRELSDNFCLYNPSYDRFEGFHPWAQTSLNEHRADQREYLYSLYQLETGRTHDDLWNAAQLELVITGKMHGFMRMYWAKKILEWTATPETALAHAIYLNDKYSIDGRDPNGYAGIAWAIGGVHDRAWGKRAIFGKIRYMNYQGCKRKFDVNSYIKKIMQLNAQHKTKS
ncbi:MAG: deoxyribodipyrimidine photo-lyase [Bacteroidales bacterium]|nr:deoxyribodipyrimidine photo-lyase [Bacteroidales bacterium]MBN2748891.1 deoxyribodipyrimidine photo-lyase [Bacteroidales bacterium]